MTTRQSLQEIAEALPSWQGATFTEHEASLAFDPRPFPGIGYIWPDVIPQTGLDQTAVLLITAPGAMGKSTAARAIAHRLSVPLIDVARMPVGEHSLTGLLFGSLGYDQAPGYIQSIQDGLGSLVIDGLDEAQLQSGREHYFAFIDDIGRMVKTASSKCQVVLLGRHDAMESAEIQLLENGVPSSKVELAPLSYSQSIRLIDSTLDQLSNGGLPYDVHRQHPQSFGEWRDDVLLLLADALEPGSAASIEEKWSLVNTFLGYPPVLLVLAQRLAVPNPSSEPRDGFTGSRASRGDILKAVIEAILEREAKKVQHLLVTALGWPDADPRIESLYLPEEQALRICNYLAHRPDSVMTPALLTGSERQTYVDQISAFLPDHPFLRDRSPANIVFSDYLRAYVCHSALSRVHNVSQVELQIAFPTLGPFLCHFLFSLSSAAHHSDVGFIHEELIDDAIHSLMAGPSADAAFVCSVVNDSLAQLHLMTSIFSVSDSLAFQITDLTGVIEISSPIRRGAIITNGGIVFRPGESGVVSIGSDCAFIAEEIQFLGRSVEFTAVDSGPSSGQSTTFIVSEHTPAHAPDLRVNVYQPKSAVISWPNPSFQWLDYVGPDMMNVPNVSTAMAMRILIAVRRMFLSFKASASGDPAIYYEFLEQSVIGSDPVFKITLPELMARGFIRRETQSYCLCLDRLAEYGINYASLRNPGFEDVLRPLVADLCKSEAIQEWARSAGTR